MNALSDRTLARLREIASGPIAAGERYVLERELGRGGMGRVWLATDTVLGREVAVKVLEDGRGRVALEGRMRDEARILAALEHPGIVPVHDLGRTAEGRLFYVMKRVQGETLDAHLAHVSDLGERLRTFERLCEPVAFAHAHGVVHRDLKPGNVMVGSFGEVLVMDWGVARVLAEGATFEDRARPGSLAGDDGRTGGPQDGAPRDFDASDDAAPGNAAPNAVPHDRTGDTLRRGTDPGTVLGTRGYMPPEQERGEPVDARADVYALGAILLQIAGAAAPPGEDPRAALAAARAVPRPLAAIAARALAPRAADRYAGVTELADDVARFRDGRPVSAYRESALEHLARWARRYRTPILLVAAYLMMRAAVALWIRQRPGP